MWLGNAIGDALPDGVLRSLIVDGLFAGVGAVIVFLPQILILFLFILVLESTGYMVRAAFLMDRLMSHAGLSGRAFIPLLSSFACAVPGIMATRTIDDPKDRLTTILVAPLMTCSARLPVYTLIIGAFIPARDVAARRRPAGAGPVRPLRRRRGRRAARRDRASPHRGEGRRRRVHDGIAQISDAAARATSRSACGSARRSSSSAPARSSSSRRSSCGRWPASRSPARARSSPTCRSPGRSATRSTSSSRRSASTRTSASRCSRRWRRAKSRSRRSARSIRSMPPTMPGVQTLGERIKGRWSLATALAFLAWFVFAPQCISTIAVTRRETNGWKWPLSWSAICSCSPISRPARPIGPRSLRARLACPRLARPNARSNDKEISMAGVNKVILVGNLGADPEARTLRQWRRGRQPARRDVRELEGPRRQAQGKDRMAHRRDLQREPRPASPRAILRKGSKVYLEGQLQTRKWQDQSGNDRYSTDVVLQNFRGDWSCSTAAKAAVAAAAAAAAASDYGGGGGGGSSAAAAVRSRSRARSRRRSTPTSTTTFPSKRLGLAAVGQRLARPLHLARQSPRVRARRKSATARRNAGVGDVVQRRGDDRLIAARELMLALRAGLDRRAGRGRWRSRSRDNSSARSGGRALPRPRPSSGRRARRAPTKLSAPAIGRPSRSARISTTASPIAATRPSNQARVR